MDSSISLRCRLIPHTQTHINVVRRTAYARIHHSCLNRLPTSDAVDSDLLEALGVRVWIGGIRHETGREGDNVVISGVWDAARAQVGIEVRPG